MGVLVVEVLVGLHRTDQISFFSITGCSIFLDYSGIEWFYEDLQDLLELTPPKDVLFTTGDWNAKVRSQETPGVIGKFGLGIQNETEQRLTEFF